MHLLLKREWVVRSHMCLALSLAINFFFTSALFFSVTPAAFSLYPFVLFLSQILIIWGFDTWATWCLTRLPASLPADPNFFFFFCPVMQIIEENIFNREKEKKKKKRTSHRIHITKVISFWKIHLTFYTLQYLNYFIIYKEICKIKVRK